MRGPVISDLTAHLGFRLRQVSNHVSHGFARRLGGHGVTVAEWVVLRELYDVEALAPSQLADRLGHSRGAISKLADRLLGKGLVSREASDTDGRGHSLRLTPAGRALVPTLASLADANDAAVFDLLADEDRAELARLLAILVDRLGIASAPVS